MTSTLAHTEYQECLAHLRYRLASHIGWLREQWQRLAPEYAGMVITDQEADWRLGSDVPPMPDAPAPALGGRLGLLAGRFQLTSLEAWTLFACLAPELAGGLERLYAYAQDDASRRALTPDIALSLFADLAGERDEALACFLPTSPLRRWRLLRVENAGGQPLAQKALALDDRVLGFLLGSNAIDERIAHLLQPVAGGQRLAASREGVAAEIEGLLGDGPVNLVGPAGAGLRSLAGAACERAGLRLFAVDLARLAGAPEPREAAALIAREVRLQGAALLIEAEPGADLALLRELSHVAPPSLVASRDRLMGAPVFVRPLPAGEQAALWKEALGPVPDDLAERLAEQFDLGPEAIAEAASATSDPGRVWQICRERGRRALDGLAQRIDGPGTWADIVLPPDTEQHVREIAGQVRHRFQVYERWGLRAKLSRGRGIAALFAGPSGCGKTMAAEVLANELGLDLYRIDLAGMISKYIGETEKNLRAIFDAAEQAGGILFFDEADALFGKRSEVRDAHDRYANIEIDYLLQRMEEYRGLAILATNMRQALDPAFLRRLRFVVEFPFPEGEQRQRIWRLAFPPGMATEGLDFAFLARLELAGGNIATIAINAAFLAAGEGAPVQMKHVLQAVRREYIKLDQPLRQSEFGPYASLVSR